METIKGDLINVAPLRGDDHTAYLPILPGVVRGPDGRVNVKGGRATQTTLLVNTSNVTDPATGDFGFNLPVDAIESVTLLPNPYAAEYGRFSSGVSTIVTRRGTQKWELSFNNFFPKFRWRDGRFRGFRSGPCGWPCADPS